MDRGLIMFDHNNNDDDNNNDSDSNNKKMFLPYNDHGQSCRAKLMAHPLFPRLLASYVNCQKVGLWFRLCFVVVHDFMWVFFFFFFFVGFFQVGAPPDVVARLEQACTVAAGNCRTVGRGDDPGLDQFMEAYCEMLSKYEQELTKPFKEAMVFFSRIESQLKALAASSSSSDGYSLSLSLYSNHVFIYVLCVCLIVVGLMRDLTSIGYETKRALQRCGNVDLEGKSGSESSKRNLFLLDMF